MEHESYTTSGDGYTGEAGATRAGAQRQGDAGRIWRARVGRFLRGYGLLQCATDLRRWELHTTLGDLVIHDHIDDMRITATTPAARLHFFSAWAA